jgi:hypothetical protein
MKKSTSRSSKGPPKNYIFEKISNFLYFYIKLSKYQFFDIFFSPETLSNCRKVQILQKRRKQLTEKCFKQVAAHCFSQEFRANPRNQSTDTVGGGEFRLQF